MARRKKKRKTDWRSQLTYELIGLCLLVIAVVTLARLGTVGETFVRLFRFFLGEWFILLTLCLLVVSIMIMFKRNAMKWWSQRMAGFFVIVISLSLFSHVGLFNQLEGYEGFKDQSVIRNTWTLFWMEMKGEIPPTDLGGGMIGSVVFAVSHFLFAKQGTYFLCFILFIIGIILLTGKSMTEVVRTVCNRLYHFGRDTSLQFIDWIKQANNKDNKRKKMNASSHRNIHAKNQKETEKEVVEETIEPEIVDFSERARRQVSNESEKISYEEIGDEDKETNNDTSLVTAEEGNELYELPTLQMLHTPKNPSQMQEKKLLTENARILEETLESFGVRAKVMKVHLGPAVTKYEVNPSIGVKVSRIVNLADDLALALAAQDIRIEAPIPGKSAIGIEVPNKEVAIVSLREVLDSNKAVHEKNVLAVGLGRDISGEPVLAHLNKMPHLLIAGATGSGKSVCINGIITSILMNAKPNEVKMMMIDPKMVELTVYNGIPHLLTPVVTEPKKAAQALKKIVAEMERRYDLFSHSGVRNIEGYNQFILQQNKEKKDDEAKQRTLPYIVVIVDELADLMMVASGEVEDAIARLAQMARAAGIHMIIATQRPSVDVITGVIKANVPSRIAFSVSSQTDSRTILDMGGAEKLLGNGDMLYMPMGASKPTRVQGAFLTDADVEKVVSHVISQQKAQYQENMIPSDEPSVQEKVEDELYDDAVRLVTEMNTASVSMLQRRFRIGYTRAARLIDEMELRGIVGPYEGSRPRTVLVDKDEGDQVSPS